MSKMMKLGIAMATGLVLLAGCAGAYRNVQLPPDAGWALLPVVNYAETPQAGQRAEAILFTLLHERGVNLRRYPPRTADALPELNDERRLQEAIDWARAANLRYGVTGSVEEWQYKAGLDGEPAVGLTVQVIDVASGRVLWSASGARSGWGYATLSGTAQELLQDLSGDMPLTK